MRKKAANATSTIARPLPNPIPAAAPAETPDEADEDNDEEGDGVGEVVAIESAVVAEELKIVVLVATHPFGGINMMVANSLGGGALNVSSVGSSQAILLSESEPQQFQRPLELL